MKYITLSLSNSNQICPYFSLSTFKLLWCTCCPLDYSVILPTKSSKLERRCQLQYFLLHCIPNSESYSRMSFWLDGKCTLLISDRLGVRNIAMKLHPFQWLRIKLVYHCNTWYINYVLRWIWNLNLDHLKRSVKLKNIEQMGGLFLFGKAMAASWKGLTLYEYKFNSRSYLLCINFYTWEFFRLTVTY